VNGRIRTLAVEAADGMLSYDEDGFRLSEKEIEKFAQLTARELIVDFYRRYLDVTSDEDITVQVERYIKDQFGVGQ
jgi:hypothetical protein